MTSKLPQAAYVWVYLPGDVEPTLCGRFDHKLTADRAVGSFVYGRSYLANPQALAIDPVALPLHGDRLFETASDQGCFGVVSDAIPDDWGRYVIDRRHGKQDFPVGYLLHSLDDRVGNLSFSAHDAERPPLRRESAPLPGLGLLDDALRIVAGLEAGQSIPPELEDRIMLNTAMGGARPKLTMAHDGAQWLAKLPSRRDDPEIPAARLEAAMLDLASRCGIGTVQARVVSLDGGDVLLVRRFDRTLIASEAHPSGWARDAYLSARSVFASRPTVQAYSFAGSYPRLARELGRYSSHPLNDRHDLFRRMVFNCATSNTDDHDRNHGFIADDDPNASPGTYRLAPAFDLVPRIHGTSRRFQALAIGDGGHAPGIDNIMSSHAAFDLTKAAALGIVGDVQAAVVDQWRHCLEDQGLSALAIRRLARCFEPLPAMAAKDVGG
ncbi:MAG: type II toxin-antitoxin system HipA family toxin [Methylibium sp.]|nr:type II toxin-antitoxin system HipA family toxin [Methylibium sp.]